MKLSEIKMALQAVLMQFKRFDAEGGFAIEVVDEELLEGAEVTVYDAEGNKLDNPDGEYAVEGKKVTILEGKIKSVEEIVKEEVEEEVKEEVKEEEKPEEEVKAEDEKDVRIAELEADVAARDEKIKELEEKIAELEKKSAAEPMHEEFEKAVEIKKTGDKKLDRLNAILFAE